MRDLLVDLSPPAVRHAGKALEAAELAMMEHDDEKTHDRWFALGFDRFLVFGADGRVYEAPEPVWDEGRVARAR